MGEGKLEVVMSEKQSGKEMNLAGGNDPLLGGRSNKNGEKRMATGRQKAFKDQCKCKKVLSAPCSFPWFLFLQSWQFN